MPNLDTIVIPKVDSASDLFLVTDILKHSLPSEHSQNHAMFPTISSPLSILALIESAKALSDLPSICKASPYLSGLIFGAEDFALDLSLTRTPSLREFLYARSAIVTACRAHSLPSAIDLVCTAYKGDASKTTLRAECLDGKGLGFNGKQCIHPSQVSTTHNAFAPSVEETDWAVRVVIANGKAEYQERGAWTMDGRMVDAPVIGKAKSIIGKAEACGIDVDSIYARWNGQEPE